MKKWVKRGVITLSALILVILFGCSAVMDIATPCYIEPTAITFSGDEPTSFMPFTTLWDADRIGRKVDYAHQLNQIALGRLIEDNELQYAFLKDVSAIHTQGAKEFQQTVFTPEGPIGLLLPALTGGTLAALLIKRPGDKSQKEVDAEIAKVKT